MVSVLYSHRVSLRCQKARAPVISSLEHDALSISRCSVSESVAAITVPSAPTAVVDAAIELFALLLPAQDLATVERFVAQVIDHARAPRLERNIGRKSAVTINVSTALVLALSNGSQNVRHARSTFGTAQVGNVMSAFLQVFY